MLYELSDLQVKNLKAIIADSTIKGAAAGAIVEVIVALESPINPGVAPAPKILPPKVQKEKK